MAARCCHRCGRGWPCTSSYTVCPVCDEQTSYDAKVRSLPSGELLEILSLLDGASKRIAAAEREAERRGPLWSVADVIVERRTVA